MSSFKLTVLLAVAVGLALSPSGAMAQAAVGSDQPVAGSGRATGLDAAPSQGTGVNAPGSRDVPNALTGPGSPGTTGTGAAGTGPTGTMAAPGR